MKWGKMIIFCFLVLIVSCNREEPFDVAYAQQRLSGKWNCVEDTGDAYEITISPNGAMNIYISNLCKTGADILVNVSLLDENNVLIPSQTVQGYKFEGTGTVEQYKHLTLDFRFGNNLAPVVAHCEKK